MVVLAYGAVIKGMILVMSPHRFRTWVERLLRNDRICRWLGITEMVLGGALLVLGLVVLG